MPDDEPRRERFRRSAGGRRHLQVVEKSEKSKEAAGNGDTGSSDGRRTSAGAGPNGAGSTRRSTRRPRPRPRVNKLRLFFVLLGLGVLALISTVFGMLMAVASDLPSLEATKEFKASHNSVLYDHTYSGKDPDKHRIAVLTGNENRILVGSRWISPSIKHAVVAIEDRRFYQHKGLDYQGIARALWADVRRQRAVQGGSTITQQFVKNALVAQTNRSVFQKLKEAALAYQLERKWSKDKILTQYLNTVYFGEGAYGIESAARVYFGSFHPGCEPHCASVLDPAESALLAGLVASPSAYSPIHDPATALKRRNLVLSQMREQGYIDEREYADLSKRALPAESQIRTPRKISKVPYYTAWVEQQLVDRYGTGATFGGGLKIRTTLDLGYQQAAEQAVARLAGVGPSVALVALDNTTGGVRAMVGGNDFEKTPFNLATQGHRQPGSAFKPFTLVAALDKGISPGRTFTSAKKTLDCPSGPFEVSNYEDRYLGTASLATATTTSDNSVYAELGCKYVGTKNVARTARQMGIRTRLSTNPAMILGGLRTGVTPLELADSYLTLAHSGSRVSGTLAAYDDGPVAYTDVRGASIDDENHTKTKRVIPEGVAQQATQILQTVISGGTGKAAALPGEFAAGKTGTTENYVDALFVGYTSTLTVAVWVGYPTGGKPMETEYRGKPVAGGTYPAEIWKDFMLRVKSIRDGRRKPDEEQELLIPAPGAAPSQGPTTGGDAQPKTDRNSNKDNRRKQREPERQAPAPDAGGEPAPPPEPQPTEPAPTPPPDGGQGGGATGQGGPAGAGGVGAPP
jgi:penicillin-binding protein 1A